MKKTLVGIVTVMLVSAASQALAQDLQGLGFETGVSTLGAYVAPTYDVTDKFSLRAPIYFGSLARTIDVEGNPVDANFAVTTGTLLLDYSPWATAFRLSGGAGIGGYNASGTVTDLTLDGVTFSGSSTVDVKQKQSVAPVLSLGFSKEFSSGLTVFADLGGRFTTYEMSVVTDLPLTPTLQAELDGSVGKINNDLSKYWATPFATFGFGYKF